MNLTLKPKAFALVEIVIAMGIAAFALTAILGLLSAGILSSRDSMDDTLVANMANAVLNDMRSRNFSEFVDVNTGNPVTSPPKDIYFDMGGRWLMSGTTPMDRAQALNPTPPDQPAVYQCTRTLRTLDSNNGGSVTPPPTSPIPYDKKLVQVTLTFRWPAQAANPPNNKVINATLTQY